MVTVPLSLVQEAFLDMICFFFTLWAPIDTILVMVLRESMIKHNGITFQSS